MESSYWEEPSMPDFWQILKDEWPVIQQAPLILLLIFAVGFVGGLIVKAKLVKDKVDGAISQRDAAKGRLELVSDKLDKAEKEKDAMERTITQLQEQITAKAPIHALAGISASVQSHVLRFDNLFKDLKTTVAISEPSVYVIEVKKKEG